MLKEQSDVTHLYKKCTQYGERYQIAKSANKRVILGLYNPLKEVLT